MNRYQITADIDATLWLGTLLHYKHVPSKIEYAKLEELFQSENSYLPTCYELEEQLMKLTGNIKHEVVAYLREHAGVEKFGMYILKVYLPLDYEARVSQFGVVSTCVNGEFETIVEMNASKEEVFDIFYNVLSAATNRAGLDIENLDACIAACLEVQKIWD